MVQLCHLLCFCTLGIIGNLQGALRPIFPTRLTKLFDGTSHQSVNYSMLTDRGDLLIYASGEVKIMDLYMSLTKASKAIENVKFLAQQKDEVIVVTFANNKIRCTSYKYDDLATLCKVCRFNSEPIPGCNSPLVVNESYLFLLDNTSSSHWLRVYDHVGSHLHSIKIGYTVLGLYSLPDDCVLIRAEQHLLLKFDPKTLLIEQLSRSTRNLLATDGAGICYSAHAGNKKRKMSTIACYKSNLGEDEHHKLFT